MKNHAAFSCARALFAWALLLAAGCGDGSSDAEKKSPASSNAASSTSSTQTQQPSSNHTNPATVTAKGTASMSGKVVFKGTAPVRQELQLKEDCAALHTGPVLSEDVIINENGTLKNVIVYVQKGLDGKKFDAPKEPVVLDQKGCTYHPHVFAVMVGQPLTIRNSDSFMHNIKASPKNNPKINIAEDKPMDASPHVFKLPEAAPVRFECNVHSWMSSYALVLTHPFFAVTGADGNFDLKDLPAGEYTLAAWHEKYGTQTQSVKIADGEKKAVEFVFESK